MKKLIMIAILLVAGCHYDNLINIDLRRIEREDQSVKTPPAATMPAEDASSLLGRYLTK